MEKKFAGIIEKDDVVSVATVHTHTIRIYMLKTMMVMHLNQSPPQPLALLHPMMESERKR